MVYLGLYGFHLGLYGFYLGLYRNYASNWSEVQSAQSREIALRGILTIDVHVLSWEDFDLGSVMTVNQGTLSDY